MSKLPHRRSSRGLFATATLVLLVAAFAAQAAPAAAGGRAARSGGHAAAVPTLPAAVMANADHAAGVVVRRTPGVTVSSIAVPAALRATHQGVPATVWRVRVDGRFPPRALRYIVYAGGHAVGYGSPSMHEDAVIAVTADRAVLTKTITARYEGGTASRVPSSALHRGKSAAASARSIAASLKPGPHATTAVTREEYDLGLSYQPPGISGNVEVLADVYYPAGLPAGPYPLVLFLHGNHSSCYSGSSAAFTWPCPAGWHILPNYIGYDYIGKKLASFGFIVVSISGNGVNVLGSQQVGDTGMRQRGELLEHHLDLWKTWNTTGAAPFGTKFVGKVDFSRLGVMGHSRGGEGAIWQVIVDRARTTPYGLDAVLPLAPVDFTRQTVNNIPLEVMLPYCDGDVSDLQGVHFFDDARYRTPGDNTMKGTIVVMGANHNFFNTTWTPSFGFPGAFNDGLSGCPGRIAEADQRKVGQVYIMDFFRRYVGGTTSLDKLFTGAKTPASITPVKVNVTYLAPDTANKRRDLDRFTSSTSLTTNQLGGAVSTSGLTVADWCAETGSDPCVTGVYENADIHLTGLPQGVLGWNAFTGNITLNIPGGSRDVSGYDVLQFRTEVNPSFTANTGVAQQALSVVLTDGSGGTASVSSSAVKNAALTYPPGVPNSGHVIMNQIRFPLSQFTGVDLTNITSVKLVFDQTNKGVIDVSDMAFTKGG
jgi:hypothetical protein